MMLKEQLIETEEPYPSVAEQPHFDEEWTVLSARPVVPIAELETRKRRRHSLKLFGAFLLASALGALVALMSIRVKELSSSSQGAVSEESVTLEANTSVTPQTDDASSQNSAAMQSSEAEAVATNTAVTPKRSVKGFEPKSHPIVIDPISIDSDDELRQISREELRRVSQEKTSTGSSEPKLVDQWQERRQRRAEPKRPLNERGAHHPRDLSNLDEIFEGSSKPPDRRY